MADLDDFVAALGKAANAAGLDCKADRASIVFAVVEPGADDPETPPIKARDMFQQSLQVSLDHIVSLDPSAIDAAIETMLAPVVTVYRRAKQEAR